MLGCPREGAGGVCRGGPPCLPLPTYLERCQCLAGAAEEELPGTVQCYGQTSSWDLSLFPANQWSRRIRRGGDKTIEAKMLVLATLVISLVLVIFVDFRTLQQLFLLLLPAFPLFFASTPTSRGVGL